MIYFVSDVHLGYLKREDDRIREDLFINFLKYIQKDATKLIIVGDLFDYWFEYNTVVPKYFYRSLAAIADLVASGIEIEYVMGNHDFGHKDFFKEEFGITIAKDDIQREYFGKKFYISHGDGKAYNDKGYLILKSILRNSLAQWLFCKMHPDWGIYLASGSSRKSREYTGEKNYGEADGMKDFAEKRIKEGYDFVVMGHRHKAEIANFPGGDYINLGEWLKKPSFGVYDGNEFKLLNFPIRD